MYNCNDSYCEMEVHHRSIRDHRIDQKKIRSKLTITEIKWFGITQK